MDIEARHYTVTVTKVLIENLSKHSRDQFIYTINGLQK